MRKCDTIRIYFFSHVYMDSSAIIAFLIAIALGALIGTEREMPWSGRIAGGGVGF